MSGSGATPTAPGGKKLLLSSTYRTYASPICFILFKHFIAMAFCLALANTGRSKPAKIAMIAITTSNSIKVKPKVALDAGWANARCRSRCGYSGVSHVLLSVISLIFRQRVFPNWICKSSVFITTNYSSMADKTDCFRLKRTAFLLVLWRPCTG